MKKTPWDDLSDEQKNLFWDKASAINLSKLQECDTNDIANITSVFINTITDIARVIYEGIDNEQTFKIKPLGWVDIGNDIYDAHIPEGLYRVFMVTEYDELKYIWYYMKWYIEEYKEQKNCESIEHGKQLCQAHYEEQMMKKLIKA
ncbi:hypothetical protein LCGC14_0342680 [marine sediment metagenome]|uniref:Uncharacterized protein n=1 Tax=marine sediment metagenome TaxID=412755 RepID=A0A0F9TDA1_9ZZZZ